MSPRTMKAGEMESRLSRWFLVRADEQRQVAYLLLLFFVLGMGLALGKGAAEALFFKRFGVEYLPWMYLASALLLSCTSLLYAAFVDRIAPERFYRVFFLLLVAMLAPLYWLVRQHAGALAYPVLFLLYEVASELLLVHCAVYINLNFTHAQGKRLTPVLLAGQQVGMIAGGLILALAVQWLGMSSVLLIWMSLLLLAWLLLGHWHGLHGPSPYFRMAPRKRKALHAALQQVGQGLNFLQRSPLLKFSLLGLFFMVLAIYLAAYAVNRVYSEHFTTEESLAAFLGLLTASTGALALSMQLFLTNRLMRNWGLRRLNLVLPTALVASYLGLLWTFSLPAALLASFSKDTLIPAFGRPVRHVFMASLPARMQGRAQALSVVLVIPLGLLVVGGALLGLQQLSHVQPFLLLGLVAALGFFMAARAMNQVYAGELLSNLRQNLFVPAGWNPVDTSIAGTLDDNRDTWEGKRSIHDFSGDDSDWNRRIHKLLTAKEEEPDRQAALFTQALADSHPQVRRTALYLLTDLYGKAKLVTQVRAGILALADPGPAQPLLADRPFPLSIHSLRTLVEFLLEQGSDPRQMQAVSGALLQRALQLRRYRDALKARSPQLHWPEMKSHWLVLQAALEEKCLATRGLALMALQQGKEDPQMAFIRAGVDSSDAQVRAQACELLLLQLPRRLYKPMQALLEPHPGPLTFTLTDGPATLLRAVLDLGDPWLSECASALLTNLEAVAHEPAL